MQKINQILNVVIFTSASLLAASYFLPVEGTWAPWQGWRGYYLSSGELVSGFNVGLIEVFPYAAGVMILLIPALLRWPKICIIKLAIFSAVWIISLVYGGTSDVWDVSLKFPKLWLILKILFIHIFVVFVIFALRGPRKKVAVLTFAAILAVSSILHQACSIAWYLLEDGLLLNIGSVTGVTSATTLFVALLIQRQLYSIKP